MNDPGHGREPRVAHLKPDVAETAQRSAARDDVHRLVAALATDDIILSEEVAYAAWKRHSHWHEAGWLALYPHEEELRRALLPYLALED